MKKSLGIDLSLWFRWIPESPHLRGAVLRKETKVFLVSGSSAFTHSMRRILGKRLDGLIKLTDPFWDVDPNSVDVLIVDLVDDIQIRAFRFPWEAKNNKKPPPGIPEAKHWAIDPAGVNQAGTVYSVQGFETQHVGVILGPDLVRREGLWQAVPRNNFSNNLRNRPPHVALPYLKRIYRTLLSRGMLSCSVFCVDGETRYFLESKILS